MSPILNPGGGAAGDGSQPGVAIVRAFPFAYNTAGILTGAALYTPTIGDVLLDGWIEIDTGWNGTTPQADIGTFGSQNTGIFAATTGEALSLTNPDTASGALACILIAQRLSGLAQMSDLTWPTSNEGQGLYVVAGAAVNFIAAPITNGARLFPTKFVSAAPIKVCVSQDGTNTGANPGASQGAATLYLVTATPV